ncbi:MAG: D-alanyl-D-alanine endopeptidase [Sedimenticola sp.]|uniref:D-alanyl-D-alanine endopeptidase n=1 Tax=Sedimenticola thiotaurini TaxID=1543721 RepID=A0A558CJH3_9GAMM|nr:D-alanyl-D-alanine endopeptidase [Sedimenticola sp.]MCW8974835.1 D-alanyl-D-alanine endopeptidase [Sedimenticola sp.]TVT48907.1 MAG: D-alanyl-D-alanine endopeptidase [Sedimenticola thiotaurini]
MLNFSPLLAGEAAIQHLSALQPQKSATTTPLAQAQAGNDSWTQLDSRKLKLRSASVLIIDSEGNEIYSKQSEEARPIGSITKLMTVMVILDSKLALDEKIPITKQDRDLIRLTGSRLRYGATLSRADLIKLALMASENRAASALARTFPGGTDAFVKAMNNKAKALGMKQSRFADPAGLKAGNVASPQDLATLVRAASRYPEIQQATTRVKMEVHPYPKRGPLTFGNTNRLLKNSAWNISLSKTGYINEAGRCLVMRAKLKGKELIIVLLNSFGKLTPFGDANRIRKWIDNGLSG